MLAEPGLHHKQRREIGIAALYVDGISERPRDRSRIFLDQRYAIVGDRGRRGHFVEAVGRACGKRREIALQSGEKVRGVTAGNSDDEVCLVVMAAIETLQIGDGHFLESRESAEIFVTVWPAFITQ